MCLISFCLSPKHLSTTRSRWCLLCLLQFLKCGNAIKYSHFIFNWHSKRTLFSILYVHIEEEEETREMRNLYTHLLRHRERERERERDREHYWKGNSSGRRKNVSTWERSKICILLSKKLTRKVCFLRMSNRNSKRMFKNVLLGCVAIHQNS